MMMRLHRLICNQWRYWSGDKDDDKSYKIWTIENWDLKNSIYNSTKTIKYLRSCQWDKIESKNRFINMINWFISKVPKQFNKEKNVFQTNGDGTNGCPHGRNETQSLPYNMLENYVKWFIQNKTTKKSYATLRRKYEKNLKWEKIF